MIAPVRVCALLFLIGVDRRASGGPELQTRVTFDPIGATRRTAYAREALSEPDDLTNWLKPVGDAVGG